jgi:hypothetical protein
VVFLGEGVVFGFWLVTGSDFFHKRSQLGFLLKSSKLADSSSANPNHVSECHTIHIPGAIITAMNL